MDLSWAACPDWQSAWDATVALVGTDVRPYHIEVGADELDRSVIRRFLEPLEFDCPLHYDRVAAQTCGYPDIIAPYSGYPTWVSAALWEPGDAPYYSSDERNLHPAFKAPRFPEVGPATNAKVATDIETEFFAPFLRGDRPRKVGSKLLSCLPKEGGVGRGAYLTWQSDILSSAGQLLAQTRTTLYYYVPRADFVALIEGGAGA